MHACIPSHGLQRSWHSCPRWVNPGKSNTPSMHHPRDRMWLPQWLDFKNGHMGKNLTQNGAKISPKMVNPRDLAGERRRWKCCTKKSNIAEILVIVHSFYWQVANSLPPAIQQHLLGCRMSSMPFLLAQTSPQFSVWISPIGPEQW